MRISLAHLGRLSVEGSCILFAAERIAQIRKLFPDDEIEMFMALRYLAPLLPAMFDRSPNPSMTSYLGVDEPCDICWSDKIHVIRNAVPDF
jgi:hypothetical protein